MKHISQMIGVRSNSVDSNRARKRKYLSATGLGKCFLPNIQPTLVNVWLLQHGYLEKNSEGKWQATEKGMPLAYSYHCSAIDFTVTGTVYWKPEMLEIIERLYIELHPDNALLKTTSYPQEKRTNPYIENIKDGLNKRNDSKGS